MLDSVRLYDRLVRAASLSALIVAAACNVQRTAFPIAIPAHGAVANSDECLMDGVVEAGWRPRGKELEGLLAERTLDPAHVLVVRVTSGNDSIRVNYADSTGLNYSVDQQGQAWIHEVAGRWLRDLSVALRRTCASPAPIYVLQKAAIVVARAEQSKASVVTAGHYDELRASAKRAAILTGACQNTSASGEVRSVSSSQTADGARAPHEILGTNCGVEMAVVERKLAEHDYSVVSWREFAGGDTPKLDLARKLGVDVLFQINSLEWTTSLGETTTAWFLSNRDGLQGDSLGAQGFLSAVLTDADILKLNALSSEAPANHVLLLKADLTAVNVATGETVWFYRRARTFVDPGTTVREALFKGTFTRTERLWTMVSPADIVHPSAPRRPTLTSGDINEPASQTLRERGRDAQLELALDDALRCFRFGECGQ